ncbi:hypothetical protein [Marinobacter shengliensis]|uniref:hypothetical protein n=1 Tax=Marinobacter shengliensis TaxID=1389223 RepID=UPI0011083ED5|nr:hypothetical protein [Marinobacter shengliensis]
MNLKCFSDVMHEAIHYARQDRMAMLDAVNDNDQIKAVESELRALRTLKQTLENHARREDGRVALQILQELASTGDPDDVESIGNTVWMAICYALQDREAMLDGVNTSGEKKSVGTEVRALWRLRTRLFPGRKTFLEQFSDEAISVPVSQLLKRDDR